MYFAKKKKKKGFTLIELLVVIAIIGILATIVVVNVNSARGKAQDAAVKGSLDSLRAAAELFYDSLTTPTYVGFCTSADFLRASTTISNVNGGTAPVCNALSTSTATQASLKTSGYWCVDNSGNSKAETAALGTATTCP